MVRLYLVRHGASEHPPGHCIGHTDAALTPAGRDAAARLGAFLAARVAPPPVVVASDLRRAVETAESLVRGGWPERPCTIVRDARLREISFGAWENRSWDDLARDDPARVERWTRDWVTFAPPEGESFLDLVRRVGNWIDEIRDGTGATTPAPGGTQVDERIAVLHAGSIRAALAHCLAWPPADAMAQPIDYASVTTIELTPRGALLRGLNERAETDAANATALVRGTCRFGTA